MDLLSVLLRKLHISQRDEVICFGVTATQWHIMAELICSQPLSMNELSCRMSLAQSTMTRVVDTLVRDGIVERVPGSRDRRIVLVRLTPEGRQLAKQVASCVKGYYARLLARIPENKRKQVLEAVKLLVMALESADEHQ